MAFFSSLDKGARCGVGVGRRIVEAHAGRIDGGESRGGGAAFRISLPQASGDAGLEGRA